MPTNRKEARESTPPPIPEAAKQEHNAQVQKEAVSWGTQFQNHTVEQLGRIHELVNEYAKPDDEKHQAKIKVLESLINKKQQEQKRIEEKARQQQEDDKAIEKLKQQMEISKPFLTDTELPEELADEPFMREPQFNEEADLPPTNLQKTKNAEARYNATVIGNARRTAEKQGNTELAALFSSLNANDIKTLETLGIHTKTKKEGIPGKKGYTVYGSDNLLQEMTLRIEELQKEIEKGETTIAQKKSEPVIKRTFKKLAALFSGPNKKEEQAQHAYEQAVASMNQLKTFLSQKGFSNPDTVVAAFHPATHLREQKNAEKEASRAAYVEQVLQNKGKQFEESFGIDDNEKQYEKRREASRQTSSPLLDNDEIELEKITEFTPSEYNEVLTPLFNEQDIDQSKIQDTFSAISATELGIQMWQYEQLQDIYNAMQLDEHAVKQMDPEDMRYILRVNNLLNVGKKELADRLIFMATQTRAATESKPHQSNTPRRESIRMRNEILKKLQSKQQKERLHQEHQRKENAQSFAQISREDIKRKVTELLKKPLNQEIINKGVAIIESAIIGPKEDVRNSTYGQNVTDIMYRFVNSSGEQGEKIAMQLGLQIMAEEHKKGKEIAFTQKDKKSSWLFTLLNNIPGKNTNEILYITELYEQLPQADRKAVEQAVLAKKKRDTAAFTAMQEAYKDGRKNGVVSYILDAVQGKKHTGNDRIVFEQFPQTSGYRKKGNNDTSPSDEINMAA